MSDRLPVLTSRRAEERIHLALRAEACDSVSGELARVALASAGRGAECVGHQGIGAEEHAAKRLAVAVPQLLATHQPMHGSRHEPWQPHPSRQVEPDDRVRRVEDEVAELHAIGAVDYPRVARDDRLDTAPQLGRVELGPPGLPVDRVELDERHAEPGGELTTEGRLPASAGRGDDRNASHERQFVACTGAARCT